MSPATASFPPNDPFPIPWLLELPEDAVYSLRKHDLRKAFLTLREYALNPYPLTDNPSPSAPANPPPNPSSSADLPLFLRLPLEIREMIYRHLLAPPSPSPIRGPHPRQLQTNICLSQSFPPSLLLLNHQIRHEALPLIYGSPTQTVYITVDYNVWVHKTRRSDLILSSALTSAIKHLHLSIHLGSEKRNNKPGDIEADARIMEVKKGVKKLRKWLAGADIQSLKISWQEPPQTYTWEQKRDVLDGLKGMRALKVDAGQINWGLNWNKGRKFRFDVEYFRELERGRQEAAGSDALTLTK
ncbi:hypothetical protein M430DRAFT_53741 [Amorphotheca resinae ATCC 22711]|uniref:2EXR domain-containing protein n=1 Tax=Amorphotheca resinae ATCC 22711 TaxID=857342 RepID=A0A2T3AS54_AMORE|nr:hypothetical protein M430DRAFT_53741 [Amorphotheca resinae ATCC 22711]PSS09209.1 hypothetical protein M430DRAFT_53741 [Amorphotheca resinae ATCC 22711]